MFKRFASEFASHLNVPLTDAELDQAVVQSLANVMRKDAQGEGEGEAEAMKDDAELRLVIRHDCV